MMSPSATSWHCRPGGSLRFPCFCAAHYLRCSVICRSFLSGHALRSSVYMAAIKEREQARSAKSRCPRFSGTSHRRSSMTGRLEGKIAIVTGGGRGGGEAIARRFAGQSAKVVLAQRTEEEGN